MKESIKKSKQIAQKIREIRRSKKVKQFELADIIGVNVDRYRDRELLYDDKHRDRVDFKVSELIAICDFLEINICDLFK